MGSEQFPVSSMNIVIPSSYQQMRAALLLDRVSFGCMGVELYPVGKLPLAQRGYGVLPYVDEDSEWDPAWVVIGCEDLTGDPIFIDTEDEDFPIYTAEHGAGRWSPQLIAFSFQHFIAILRQVQRLARGRENPVALERNPISEAEREEVLAFIRRNNPDVSMDFWEFWLETPE